MSEALSPYDANDLDTVSKADYEALAAFRRALRRFLHFSEEAAHKEGLTPQQHQLLLAIKGQQGQEWATVSELADHLQIRHNAAVGLVDRCEALKLVRRSPGMEDRRQVRVELTEKGETILAHLSQRHRDELRALRSALLLPFLTESGEAERESHRERDAR